MSDASLLGDQFSFCARSFDSKLTIILEVFIDLGKVACPTSQKGKIDATSETQKLLQSFDDPFSFSRIPSP
jgi:hypothetical protein